jgi:hypothetical protein
MVSLAQAQAVQKFEAEGWRIVQPSRKRAKGGPVMMKRQSLHFGSKALA